MKRENSSSYSIIERPELFFGTTVLGILLILFNISIILIAKKQNDTIRDLLPVLWIFPFTIFYAAVWIWQSPVWLKRIVFTPDEIQIRRLFRQLVRCPYKTYSYVYRGTYFHPGPGGDIGYFPQFLVLSRRYMRPVELANINRLQDPDNVITLRITKRRYKKLLPALPPYIRHMAESYWGERFGKK